MSVGDTTEVGLLSGARTPVAGPTSAISATRGRSALSYAELNEAFEVLQEQSRRTGAALGTAAHQLNTPLAIVAGYVEILLSGKTGALNERQRRILEESSLNCARLRRFVDDFLSFSALEAGKITLKLEEADLHACLSELRDYWLPSFSKKEVTLSLAHPRIPSNRFRLTTTRSSMLSRTCLKTRSSSRPQEVRSNSRSNPTTGSAAARLGATSARIGVRGRRAHRTPCA